MGKLITFSMVVMVLTASMVFNAGKKTIEQAQEKRAKTYQELGIDY